MFELFLFILNLKLIKYKKTLIVPLQELESTKKIKFIDFHSNQINKKYWFMMKYYSYLIFFTSTSVYINN